MLSHKKRKETPETMLGASAGRTLGHKIIREGWTLIGFVGNSVRPLITFFFLLSFTRDHFSKPDSILSLTMCSGKHMVT